MRTRPLRNALRLALSLSAAVVCGLAVWTQRT
ncbi:hypothetical protein BJ968_002535 [Kineococcus aurantiacus]|uniref:Uncharacterized protein n=1 Tax=Kineococcus aurantiacus TaxID=37633 RepID=A0A7Y9DLY1_9ACTN|nr:hypothetical protein [Kineococcus aurantiacus]